MLLWIIITICLVVIATIRGLFIAATCLVKHQRLQASRTESAVGRRLLNLEMFSDAISNAMFTAMGVLLENVENVGAENMRGKDILAVDARNEKILEAEHLENITGRSSDIPDKYQDGAEFTTTNLRTPKILVVILRTPAINI